jgi:putative ABC transport system substrate-binding protein
MKRLLLKSFFISILILLIFTPQIYAREKVIAVVLSRDITPYSEALRGFEDYLNDQGEKFWIASPYNIHGKHDDSLENANIIKEIRVKRPDLVLAIGTPAAMLMQKNIKDIPIVFSQVLNPVASNLVTSMNSSGSNLSGSSMDISYKTQFKKMKETLPNLKNIGVLYNPTENEATIRKAINAASSLGIKLIPVQVRDEKLVPKALLDTFPDIDALWAVADSTVFSKDSIRYILEQTIKNNKPFMGLSEHFVKAGALIALSCDYYDIGRQSGEVALKIFKGKKPANIPITTPGKIKLFLNLRTADYLKLRIPDNIVSSAEKIY